jgi:hypothetical protein
MSNERALAQVKRISELEPTEVNDLATRLLPKFAKDLNRDQARQVAEVALAYGLDPFMNELIPFQGQPYITIAGRLRIASEHPMFDGEQTAPATADERKALGVNEQEIVWRCTVYRRDRRMPTVAYGRAGGPAETNPVARRWTAEMAIKRAQHRALRAAFPNPVPQLAEAPEALELRVDERITPDQIKALHALDREAGVPDDERHLIIDAQFGVRSADELTATQASVYMDGRTVADALVPESVDVDDAPEEDDPIDEAEPMTWTEFWFAVRGTKSLPTTQSALINWLGQDVHEMAPADAWTLVQDKLASSRAAQGQTASGK